MLVAPFIVLTLVIVIVNIVDQPSTSTEVSLRPATKMMDSFAMYLQSLPTTKQDIIKSYPVGLTMSEILSDNTKTSHMKYAAEEYVKAQLQDPSIYETVYVESPSVFSDKKGNYAFQVNVYYRTRGLFNVSSTMAVTVFLDYSGEKVVSLRNR